MINQTRKITVPENCCGQIDFSEKNMANSEEKSIYELY